MLYIATVHHRSARWIEIQARYLREHIPVEHQTWTSLEGIDPSYGVHFDRVISQSGPHPGKLNHLALEIAQVARAEDLLMFLDGDAFPIANPMGLIEESLRRAPLMAVRRAENADFPQPHPCFCVTTVGTWADLAGDWSRGPTWTGANGTPVSDVGANLMRRLEIANTPWVEVLRSNPAELDPLHFAIYGGVVYHHGAAFRQIGALSDAHRARAPRRLRRRNPLLRAFDPVLNPLRWKRWERAEKQRLVSESERMYLAISSGGEGWLERIS